MVFTEQKDSFPDSTCQISKPNTEAKHLYGDIPFPVLEM